MTTPTIEDNLTNKFVERQFNVASGELRFVDDGALEGRIRGIAAPWYTITERVGYPEQIARGAFINSVSPDTPLPLRAEHAVTVGQIDSITDTDRGLEIEAEIYDTSWGLDLRKLVARRMVKSFSVGMWVREWDRDPDTGVVTIRKAELFEVSAVTTPAYETARIESIRSAIHSELAEPAVEETTEPALVVEEATAHTPVALEVTDLAPETATASEPTTEEVRTADPDQSGKEPEEDNQMTDTLIESVEALRSDVADLKTNNNAGEIRDALGTLTTRLEELARDARQEPVDNGGDTRSIGHLLNAVQRGDKTAESTINHAQAHLRAFADESGVVADVNKQPTYIEKGLKIVADNSAFAEEFTSAPLPANTSVITYKVVNEDTIDADIQANEGDDLTKGKITFRDEIERVKTIGGWSEASLQEILLAGGPGGVNIINIIYNALLKRIGRAKNVYVRNKYTSTWTENVNTSTAGGHVAKVDGKDFLTLKSGWKASDIIGLIVDGAGIFDQNDNSLDGMMSDGAFFKSLATATDLSNRPIFNVYGTGVNTFGEFNPKALGGTVANVRVHLDPNAATNGKLGFYSRDAITRFESNGFQLQDTNVVNLSRQFSAFQFIAAAVTEPKGIVPIKQA